MDGGLIKVILGNPLAQGYLASVLLEVIRGFAAAFDKQGKVDDLRPYFEKGVVIMTILVAILKAALDGHLAQAPWEEIVNAIVFFLGAKAAPANQTKKLTQGLVGEVKALL